MSKQLTSIITWEPITEDCDAIHFNSLLTDGVVTAYGTVIIDEDDTTAYDQNENKIRQFHPTHFANMPVPDLTEEAEQPNDGPAPTITLTQKQAGSYFNGIDAEGNTWTCWNGNLPGKCMICQQPLTNGFVKLDANGNTDWEQVVCDTHINWHLLNDGPAPYRIVELRPDTSETTKFLAYPNSGIDAEGNTWTVFTGTIQQSCQICQATICAGYVQIDQNNIIPSSAVCFTHVEAI